MRVGHVPRADLTRTWGTVRWVTRSGMRDGGELAEVEVTSGEVTSAELRVPAAAAPRVGDPDRPEHLGGLAGRLQIASRALALCALATGALVLLGYAARSSTLIRVFPGLPPMYPNAALGFVGGGIGAIAAASPLRRARPVALAGAALIGGIGLVTLGLHIAQAGPTWVEGLWPDHPVVAATTDVGGRPVAETCVAFILLGGGIALAGLRRAPRVGQALALGALAVGASAVFGYVIGVDRSTLGTPFVGIGMAIHTGGGIAMLGAAILVCRPIVGIVGTWTSAGLGGRLGRRLVAAVVAAPLVLSALAAWMSKVLPDDGLALSFVTVVQVGALGALAMVPASAIDELDRVAAQARRESRQVAETARARDEVRRTIGAQLLPTASAPAGWELAIRQEPAYGMLAGDAMEVLHDEHRLLVAVIDVAGHGTGPALQAYRLRVELAALWSQGVPIDRMVDRLDRTVAQLGTIATGVVLEVEVRTGRARYVNAGHPAPALVRDGRVTEWPRTGPLLGVRGVRRVVETILHRDDVFVAFTDGLSEARHARGPLLGDDVIRRLIGQWAHDGPEVVAAACLDAARAHTGDRLADDAVIVALRRG